MTPIHDATCNGPIDLPEFAPGDSISTDRLNNLIRAYASLATEVVMLRGEVADLRRQVDATLGTDGRGRPLGISTESSVRHRGTTPGMR